MGAAKISGGGGGNHEKQGICSEYLPHKSFTNYKGKKQLSIQWRNLAESTLTRWLNTIANKILYSFSVTHWERPNYNFIVFLPNMHNLNLIMRKHQTKIEEYSTK